MPDNPIQPTPLRGTWWVEGRPDIEVAGTLTRVGEVWQLDVHGILPGGVMWTRGLSVTAPVQIHGRSGYKLATLRGAYLIAGNPSEHLGTKDGEDGWQTWRAPQFVRGANLEADSKLSAATFSLTRLESWWRASGITRGTTDYQSYQQPEPLTAAWGGAEIVLWNRLSISSGIRSNGVAEQPVVSVHSADGCTLDWLMESVVLPLEALLAACIHKPVTAYGFDLELADAGDWPDSAELNPGTSPDIDPSWAYDMPVLSAEQIDFPTFLPRWLDMAEAIPLVVASCSRSERDDPLQIAVVSALHTAETLERWLHQAEPSTELVEQVAALLESSELTGPQRKKILRAVSLSTQPSLERRLVHLGRGLGEEFHLWFLNGSLPEWASVAATVRNALSHGYPTAHRIERDIGALLGILYTVTAVTRLRMLVYAGLPNDFELVRLLVKDQRYLGLLHQNVADWKALAAKIRNPE